MRKTSAWMAVIVTAALAAAPASAQSSGISAVTQWTSNCVGAARPWWDDLCQGWQNNLTGWQKWGRNGSEVKPVRYADNKVKPWGIDDTGSGLDWNNAGMICVHGGWKTGEWNGTPFSMDEEGFCALSPSRMRVGKSSGGSLRFLHLSSCNSAQYGQMGQWKKSADGVHLITGFHGLMYIGSPWVGDYEDLALEGMSSRGVGKVWLDQMYAAGAWYNTYQESCPVSIGFGRSLQEARDAFAETYKANRPSNGPATYMLFKWISGCNPTDGVLMP